MPFVSQNKGFQVSVWLATYTLTVLSAIAGIAYSSIRGEGTPVITLTDSFEFVPDTAMTEEPSIANNLRR